MRQRSSNQRDYYRVDCRAIVGITPVGERLPTGRGAESFFGESGHFDLLRELRRLDQEGGSLLHLIGEADRSLGTYLHVVNRKIDAIARHMMMLTPELRSGGEQNVSISEGGIAFGNPDALEPGSLVAVRVMLLPAGAAFAAYASVITAEPRPEGGFQLTLNFENLQEAERQLIARHVMQVQMAEQRRKAGRE